jgi:hypothetical protein
MLLIAALTFGRLSLRILAQMLVDHAFGIFYLGHWNLFVI